MLPARGVFVNYIGTKKGVFVPVGVFLEKKFFYPSRQRKERILNGSSSNNSRRKQMGVLKIQLVILNACKCACC